MAKIEIVKSLKDNILKQFKSESKKIFLFLKSLGDNPKKGKLLGTVRGVVIKELKYKNFHFYFIADGYKIRYLSEEELVDLLLRFVRMSDKKHQQETINEIKHILQILGPSGLST